MEKNKYKTEKNARDKGSSARPKSYLWDVKWVFRWNLKEKKVCFIFLHGWHFAGWLVGCVRANAFGQQKENSQGLFALHVRGGGGGIVELSQGKHRKWNSYNVWDYSLRHLIYEPERGTIKFSEFVTKKKKILYSTYLRSFDGNTNNLWSTPLFIKYITIYTSTKWNSLPAVNFHKRSRIIMKRCYINQILVTHDFQWFPVFIFLVILISIFL